jgi:lipopolysaccharide/colanic/teichoic acid biosynthesis glycosyltransferase
MSVIGPRPLTPRLHARFPEAYKQATARVRPGLSGIGSVVFRGEENLLHNTTDRDAVYFDLIAPYKADLEVWYAQHQGFLVDLKLIGLTLLAVFSSRPVDTGRYFSDLPPVPKALAALMAKAD